MNKKPVYYMQTDAHWKLLPYRVKGEKSTIGSAGCGPTSAAMVITTLTGKKVTPVDTCAWSIQHGYKAYKQGTYYSYFVPQFRAYGLNCFRLNTASGYGDPSLSVHKKALELVKEGYYLIALMGKGNWTSSGHFVVLWWANGKVYINDPASQKISRTCADVKLFQSQCKYYWAIDARAYNRGDDDMITQEQFNKMMEVYLKEVSKQAPSTWSESAREWAENIGLVKGDNTGAKAYKAPVTKETLVEMLKRFHEMQGK